MRNITARSIIGTINLGLTLQDLLEELDDRFPNQSPQYREDHDKLMWRGGQRDVVDWIRSRIIEDNEDKPND